MFVCTYSARPPGPGLKTDLQSFKQHQSWFHYVHKHIDGSASAMLLWFSSNIYHRSADKNVSFSFWLKTREKLRNEKKTYTRNCDVSETVFNSRKSVYATALTSKWIKDRAIQRERRNPLLFRLFFLLCDFILIRNHYQKFDLSNKFYFESPLKCQNYFWLEKKEFMICQRHKRYIYHTFWDGFGFSVSKIERENISIT